MHIDFNLSVTSLPNMSDFCVVGSEPAGMSRSVSAFPFGLLKLLLPGLVLGTFQAKTIPIRAIQ